MASEVQIFSREMILSAYKAVRQLSRVLYKSALFMQNEPNLVRRRRIANSVLTKDYRKKDDFAVQKNKPNSKPISNGKKSDTWRSKLAIHLPPSQFEACFVSTEHGQKDFDKTITAVRKLAF